MARKKSDIWKNLGRKRRINIWRLQKPIKNRAYGANPGMFNMMSDSSKRSFLLHRKKQRRIRWGQKFHKGKRIPWENTMWRYLPALPGFAKKRRRQVEKKLKTSINSNPLLMENPLTQIRGGSKLRKNENPLLAVRAANFGAGGLFFL